MRLVAPRVYKKIYLVQTEVSHFIYPKNTNFQVVNYLGWLEMISSGNGRPSRTSHLQDIDYSYEGDYENSGDEEHSSPYAGCEGRIYLIHIYLEELFI